MTGFPLHLLRHGAPEIPGRMLGRTDCKPTPEGVAACIQQAEGLDVDTFMSSDLSRAQMPGTALAEASGQSLVVDPRWRELDFGDWDGLASAEVDPLALGQFWRDPDGCPPPGGERWSALTDRVRAAIHDLSPRPTLVVTHGGAMRAALALLCGFDARQVWAFDLPYASLLSLRIWPGGQLSAQIVGLKP